MATKGVVMEGKPEKVFINRKFYDKDFSSQDLTHADFRGCTLVSCNFNHSDLSYATFEGANCYRSSFVQSRLYHANFKDAVTAEVIMDPRDFFGVTLSISCDTFDKMTLGGNYPLIWIYLLTLAKLPETLAEKLKKLLVEELGQGRYEALEKIFANRQI